MESAKSKMTDEAKETVKRILVHIINPLHEHDRDAIIRHLCDTFDIYPHDPLY